MFDPCWFSKRLKTRLFYIIVPVTSQESKRSCICVIGVSVLPLSTILISIGFWNCSDGVVVIVFHFITTFNNFFNYILTPYLLGSNVQQSSLRSHQVIIIYQGGIRDKLGQSNTTTLLAQI